MLALTRRVGEEIVIGDPKKPLGILRIVDINGDKVRLSFDFPRDVDINRRELAEQKARGVDYSAQRQPVTAVTPVITGQPAAPGATAA